MRETTAAVNPKDKEGARVNEENLAGFLWSAADLLPGHLRQSQYAVGHLRSPFCGVWSACSNLHARKLRQAAGEELRQARGHARPSAWQGARTRRGRGAWVRMIGTALHAATAEDQQHCGEHCSVRHRPRSPLPLLRPHGAARCHAPAHRRHGRDGVGPRPGPLPPAARRRRRPRRARGH